MLALSFQSPVQPSSAFWFDLQLSDQQHEQLQDLETHWIQYALEQVTCSYQYPRHTQPRDISGYGALLKVRQGSGSSGLGICPEADEQWNAILTPEQAKRWKQRELQTVIQLNRSAILLADFRSAREGREPLDTGTWMDNNAALPDASR